MLFNSITYAIFLPIIFSLYWFVTNKDIRIQNSLLLFASYYFYACWDWRFLFLLVFSTLLDYYTGIKISASENKSVRKIWFMISISINLGFLGIFKYYNFFADTFSNAISNFGFHVEPWTLLVILPVGISFYTFHGLSYVIDIYKNKIQPEKIFVNYAVFVSFFPLLVAGPIERATHLLPQIKAKRKFDYNRSVDGLRQILWGLFKKIVIADQCAEYVNLIFNDSVNYSGRTLVMGAVLFAFQIYGDFSGYSDIAIGTAKLFGINLLQNFAFPYFSRDISEFWRRWHMSLSSWFRDYLYIPMGGSKGNVWMKIRNTFIVFLVSGFWHGANWTFIVWGLLNAIYIMPSIVLSTNRNNLVTVAKGKYFPSIRELLSIILTFILTVFAWIFFRSNSMSQAIAYVIGIFSTFNDKISLGHSSGIIIPILLCTIFLIIEWIGREQKFAIANLGSKWPKPFRWITYYLIVFFILYFSDSEEKFIYFQF